MPNNAKARKSKKDKGFGERVVFLTDRDQQAWLQAQSEATGAPIGHIVRRAVAEYRQRLGKRAAKPAPAAASATAPEKPADEQVCPACHGEKGRIRVCLVCKGTGRVVQSAAALPADTALPF